MVLPKWLARLNRRVTNPILRHLAGLPWFGVLHHVGRRSGREYSIPINVFRCGDGWLFALTYGPDTDWVKNVMAAGGAYLDHRGRRIELTEPEWLDRERAVPCLPIPVRLAMPVIGVDHFILMREAPPSTLPT